MASRQPTEQESSGLPPSTLFVLDKLEAHGQLPRSELCEQTRLSPSTVTLAVRRLEEAGLASRSRASYDLRKTVVSLTDDYERRLDELGL